MIPESVLNRNEFFSNHYLDTLIDSDLRDLRSKRKELEGKGEPTPRTRLAAATKSYFAAKSVLGDRGANEAEVARDMNAAVLEALGIEPVQEELELTRSQSDVRITVAGKVELHTGLHLVALDLGVAADIDQALDSNEAGHLLEPMLIDDGRDKITDAADAASYIFACDDAPRFVLLCAGGIVVLADQAKWGEGRFLAADVDLALSRRETKAGGELDTIASLFSTDALVPADGASVLEQLEQKSQKHAVGVSKDLRDGIRYSVEILANEAVQQIRASKKGVFNVEDIANDLTKQSLRFLYRLLVLLYAEARPELGVLPTDTPEYAEGYGLDRLRDLALRPLETEQARNGSHLHESLNLLFKYVNEGYHEASVHTSVAGQFISDFGEVSDDVGLRFSALHSDLFAPASTALLNSVTLRNEALQKVLKLLLLSKEQRGKQRGFVSYAQLGINQLGAVYERLMSYTGFFAKKNEALYEVCKPGEEDKGTWVVPVDKADEYDDELFVRRPNLETGQLERVRHEPGSFVFRMSGRDRQRSASYYTPEVLTRCVVKHALAELLDQNDETTPAQAILEMTVCEPALGSGAFLNEAINQLAAEYLRRRQAELGESLDPDSYVMELQKVRAHLALHQSYGVDLNSTAVELAEVSLWLNCMYPGLQAPWFGMHLRRGNSLVGARRAVYSVEQVADGSWIKTPPTDRKLSDGAIGDDEIHHFLLPAHGWAAVIDEKKAKELRPEQVASLREWRKAITAKPSKQQRERLVGLSKRVEVSWAEATQRLKVAEHELRRDIDVWRAERDGAALKRTPRTKQAVEDALNAANSQLSRLRLVMNSWCAMWFWPLDGEKPPVLNEWLDALEALLGKADAVEHDGQRVLFESLDDFVEDDRRSSFTAGMWAVADVIERYPWLKQVQTITDQEGFWHWELEFAPVFERGGFDLQVGNPPWVRLDWEDAIVLAEYDSWFGPVEDPGEEEVLGRRQRLLASKEVAARYLAELTSLSALVSILGSGVTQPLTHAIRTNLYMLFMSATWVHASAFGIVGLLHPEGHFADPKAREFRRETYKRLRRHWQFEHTRLMFEDVQDRKAFSINIYGCCKAPHFWQISGLTTSVGSIDKSIAHDGQGPVPSLQYPTGGWDTRPHHARLVEVDIDVLASWAALIDDPGTAAVEARLLRPISVHDLGAIRALGTGGERIANRNYNWSSGLNEKNAKRDRIIEPVSTQPTNLNAVVLQGPHFTVANPYAQEPRSVYRHNSDYDDIDLETLQERPQRRTNFRCIVDREALDVAVGAWAGRPSTSYWRMMYREMCLPSQERSVQAALLQPGPTHVNAVVTTSLSTNNETVLLCGLFSSIPFDYVVKLSGLGHLKDYLVRRLPFPGVSPFYRPLAHRTLRLNCLTADYAPLWDEQFDDAWKQDLWTYDNARLALNDVEATWSMKTPLRTDFDRRKALVEIDALAALILGLTAEQLCAMYRSQFAVLRKYEYNMAFDVNGRVVAKDHQKAGIHQQKGDWELAEKYVEDPDAFEPPKGWFYQPPFVRPDREAEMTQAYNEFQRRFEAGEYAE